MIFSKVASLMIYLGVYTASSVCLHFSVKSANKCFRALFYFFALLIAVLFAAIRYKVGTDYSTYVSMCKGLWKTSFAEIIADFKFESTPVGVFIFAKIAQLFNSVEVFFLLFALAIFIPVSRVIIEYKDSVSVFLMSFAFLTTLYTTGFNIMKQAVAVSISLYAVQSVFDRNPLKFAFWGVVACCFHPTALIVFPIYFLGKTYDKKFMLAQGRVALFIVGTIILLLIYPTILSAIGGRFEEYLSNGGEGNNYTVILITLWFLLMLGFSNQLIEEDYRNALYIVLFFIGLLFELLGFKSPYIKRVALYFLAFDIILIPQMVKIFAKQYESIMSFVVYLYYVLLFFVDFYLLQHSNIIPYMVK